MRTTNRLAILAALAPSASNHHHGRTPFGRRPVRNVEGTAGAADGATVAKPTTPAKEPAAAAEEPARTFTQADVDRIVGREKGKAAKDLAAAQARVAEYEAREAETADKTKGAVEAVDAKAKRALEVAAKERDEAKAAATATHTRYHASLIDGGAAKALAGIEFVGADAAELVEAGLRSKLKVEDENGVDVVYLVEGKVEIPVTDREKVAAYIRKRWPSLVKAQSGAGGPHGKGSGKTTADLSGMSPREKITHGLREAEKK